MIIKYCTNKHNCKIKMIQIQSEDSHYVYIKDNPFLKESDYLSFFNTSEEAVLNLMEHNHNKILKLKAEFDELHLKQIELFSVYQNENSIPLISKIKGIV